VAGLSTIYSGDDRYYNNIFLGSGDDAVKRDARYHYGLTGYDHVKLPVWITGNIYYNRAIHYKDETDYVENKNFTPDFNVTEEDGHAFLNLTLDESGSGPLTLLISTALLGKAKMPDESFENPDGSPLKIDTDYFGKMRPGVNPSPGPFENPGKGKIRLQVW
jgi:hypothetical protein